MTRIAQFGDATLTPLEVSLPSMVVAHISDAVHSVLLYIQGYSDTYAL